MSSLQCIQIITGDYAQQFSRSYQCDSQEFLMYFLEGLHKDIKEHVPTASENVLSINSDTTVRNEAAKDAHSKYMLPENQSKISELFQGWLETFMTCGNEECGKVIIYNYYSILLVLHVLLHFSETRCSKLVMLSCFCPFHFLMQLHTDPEECTGIMIMGYDCVATGYHNRVYSFIIRYILMYKVLYNNA